MIAKSERVATDPELGDIYTVELGFEASEFYAQFVSIGAALTHLYIPDNQGNSADVVLGFDDWEDYKTNSCYLGAVCGRFANRIKNAQFELKGVTYTLPVNNGPNSLHGGIHGFSFKNWTVESYGSSEHEAHVTFYCESADGEEGYPGAMKVWVTYTLSDAMTLNIAYRAISDKDTVLNLTNHTYFNLKGEGQGNVLGHFLQMDAMHYLELDKDCCPTGKIMSVHNTPFDFTKVHDIGFRIYEKDAQLQYGKGYDTCYCYKPHPGTLERVATLYESASHRRVDVFTDLPGIQVYTGNWLGHLAGKSLYHDYEGVALETQNFPAAPNFDNFPSTVIRAGQQYTTVTEYRFSVM